MPQTKKNQETFDIGKLLYRLRDALWIRIGDESLDGLSDGDLLLVGRNRKKPTEGDYVAYQDEEGAFFVEQFSKDKGEPEGTLYGVATAVFRRFLKTKKATGKSAGQMGGTKSDGQAEKLRQKLMRLERLPENEAIAFQLETQIYHLERGSKTDAEKWPDVIGE
jgi:hypothetical protein